MRPLLLSAGMNLSTARLLALSSMPHAVLVVDAIERPPIEPLLKEAERDFSNLEVARYAVSNSSEQLERDSYHRPQNQPFYRSLPKRRRRK